MTSVDGRCKTFDKKANGYARSEGVGAVVLESGKHELCLTGVGLRQDGRSASLTAPNGSAQSTLILNALGAMVPEDVTSIEAHGTGTGLGDPTEAGGLAKVHGVTARSPPLVVGAAKASIGHNESPSGHVGMLRLRQILQSGAASGNVQLRILNPLVGDRLKRASMVLPTHGSTVGRGSVGVSAFGFSGTIAHALMMSPAPASAASQPKRKLRYTRLPYEWIQSNTSGGDLSETGMFSANWAMLPSKKSTSDQTPSVLVVYSLPSAVPEYPSYMEPSRAKVAPTGTGPKSSPSTLAVVLDMSVSSTPSFTGLRVCFKATKEILSMKNAPPRLLFITLGTQPCPSSAPPAASDAANSGPIGLARVIRYEHGAMDVVNAGSTAGAGALEAARTLMSQVTGKEAELACTPTGGLVASRLRRSNTAPRPGEAQPVHGGTFIITGGLGGLGLRGAEMLVDAGSTRVVLTSRGGKAARSEKEQFDSVCAIPGAMVHVFASDGSDPSDGGRVLDLTGATLAGTLHASGILRDKMLLFMRMGDVSQSLAAKALALSYLYNASARVGAEAAVVFSSVTSTFGNVGQANYAASNVYQDKVTSIRRLRGLFGASLQIPAVQGAGMGAATFTKEQLDSMGSIALDEFSRCLQLSATWLRGEAQVSEGSKRRLLLLLLVRATNGLRFESWRGRACWRRCHLPSSRA